MTPPQTGSAARSIMTPGDSLVSLSGVSKKLCRDARRSMFYGLGDLASGTLGLRERRGQLRPGEFWAVQDVDVQVRRGECLGVIGPNGSGKSTLLKMINGIMLPDRGRIVLRGRVGSLIELGAGFHPLLTGRENILVNGAILGYSKRALAGHVDRIIEFAELSEFIDMPVRYYSSGMYVRLGFAIAAHFKPDILLIDEVLAVGDIRFRARCFNAVYSMLQDTAVVIVSHNMADISRVCTQLLVLDRGRPVYCGEDVSAGIERYSASTEPGKAVLVQDPRVQLHGLRISSQGVETRRFASFDPVTVEFDVTVDAGVRDPAFYVSFAGRDTQPVMQCCSVNGVARIVNNGSRMLVSVAMDELRLNPGTYALTAGVTTRSHGEVLLKYHNAADILVVGEVVGYAPVQSRGDWKSTASGAQAT